MNKGFSSKYLASWIAGAIVVVLVEIWAGYHLMLLDNAAPAIAAFSILVVVPILYLTLMLITLRHP